MNIIQADYDTLAEIAQQFSERSDSIEQMRGVLTQHVEALRGSGWEGEAAVSFFQEMESTVFPVVGRLRDALGEANRATLQIIEIVRAGEDEAAEPFRAREESAAIPFGPAVTMQTPTPNDTPQPVPVPHPAPTPTPVSTPAPPANGGDGASRDGDLRERRTDRRVDREVRSDSRWRRKPGGSREGNSNFNNDWAGRSILERYLTGGGDWHIKDNPNWTEYMQENEILTTKLRDRALETAQGMFQNGQRAMTINETGSMQIENGEGIVGYQYLHGTNANAGGFQRDGTATMTPNGSGGYTVRLEMSYTWNDIIDPNPKYSTDRWKSRVAEIITLGQADAYSIHINWTETTIVELDANGNPISIRNE